MQTRLFGEYGDRGVPAHVVLDHVRRVRRAESRVLDVGDLVANALRIDL
jgi:hypothetical protein